MDLKYPIRIDLRNELSETGFSYDECLNAGQGTLNRSGRGIGRETPMLILPFSISSSWFPQTIKAFRQKSLPPS
jgi:hypothetical protein